MTIFLPLEIILVYNKDMNNKNKENKVEHQIKSVTISLHDSSYGGFRYVAEIEAEYDSKFYSKIKDLGHAYMQISNEVYRQYGIPMYNPTVDSSRRSKRGIKTVSLRFYFNDDVLAEKLGIKMLHTRSGETIPEYGSRVTLKDKVVDTYTGVAAPTRIYG